MNEYLYKILYSEDKELTNLYIEFEGHQEITDLLTLQASVIRINKYLLDENIRLKDLIHEVSKDLKMLIRIERHKEKNRIKIEESKLKKLKLAVGKC